LAGNAAPIIITILCVKIPTREPIKVIDRRGCRVLRPVSARELPHLVLRSSVDANIDDLATINIRVDIMVKVGALVGYDSIVFLYVSSQLDITITGRGLADIGIAAKRKIEPVYVSVPRATCDPTFGEPLSSCVGIG